MALNILGNGIVQRHKDGSTTILRPGRNGGTGTEIEVPEALADRFRLVTGDVAEGTTLPVVEAIPDDFEADADFEDGPDQDEQFDEPSFAQSSYSRSAYPGPPVTKALPFPTERLTAIARINGLTPEEAEARPFPRTRRSASERTPPDRRLLLAVGPNDDTGRMLDFAAPLGAGGVGVVRGMHGSGLTRTLRAVLKGITAHAPDCLCLLLLLRARAEEITDWRRQFPQADILVASSTPDTMTPEQTLRLCDLALETAQRQTEMGRDVVLLIDSLTGLWGAMLEAEEADAQQEADQSAARQRLREWVQRAGCFHGETPLGGSLGGSLTILGTVWHQPVDEEAEEERDIHPHLRLMEHLAHEITWRVVLSDRLAEQRLYPALHIKECFSHAEDRLLPEEEKELLWKARATLPRHQPLECYHTLIEALEATGNSHELLQYLLEK